MGMIDQIMKMISGETELDNVIQKAMISGDTDRALEDNGEAYFKYDKEENSFSVKVIGSVFFIGHTAGRLIGQFYEAQKRNGTWDEKAKKKLCNLLSGGITYTLLDGKEEEEKNFKTVDAAYSQGIDVLNEIAKAAAKEDESSKETIEKQQAEIEALKKQAESLQYALAKTVQSALAGVEIQPANSFMGIPIEEAIEVLRKHAEAKR